MARSAVRLGLMVLGLQAYVLAAGDQSPPQPLAANSHDNNGAKPCDVSRPPVDGPHDPVPLKSDEGTSLDGILERLAKEESRYDPLEVVATTSYQLLIPQEEAAQWHPTIVLRIDGREWSVLAGNRAFREVRRENKNADGTTGSTFSRQAHDGWWTREYRHDGNGKAEHQALIQLGAKEHLRLLCAHTMLFHEEQINGHWLATYLASGMFNKTQTMTVEYLGAERVDDLYCYKLKCALPRDNKVDDFFLLWLARDRNLLPVRFEWIEPKQSMTLPTGVCYAKELREVRPGLWFPFRTTDVTYQKEHLKEGRVLLQWREDIAVEKATVAGPVDDRLFSCVEAPEGTEIHVRDCHGEWIGQFRQPRTGNIEIGLDELHAMERAYEAEEDDHYQSDDSDTRRRKARIDAAFALLQADPPASRTQRIDAALEILRHYRVFQTHTKKWASAIRELILIGRPVVPRLIEELDHTNHAADQGRELCALGFVLRGIGDPRAVPALIRALPHTLQPLYSDYGACVSDRELLLFMQRHDHEHTARGTNFSFGRPINEVLPALQELTGVDTVVPGEGSVREFKNIYYTFLGGCKEDVLRKQKLFLRFAERWAEWWGKNWVFFVKDQSEAQLDETRRALAPPAEEKPKPQNDHSG